jgi:hypothetical protein
LPVESLILERASLAAPELERGEWRPKMKFQFSSVQGNIREGKVVVEVRTNEQTYRKHIVVGMGEYQNQMAWANFILTSLRHVINHDDARSIVSAF